MGLLPSGYDCLTCGEHHAFGTWVYAQWEKELPHTCLKCVTEHVICQGVARRVSWIVMDEEDLDGLREATA